MCKSVAVEPREAHGRHMGCTRQGIGFGAMCARAMRRWGSRWTRDLTQPGSAGYRCVAAGHG
eukprot:3255920-Prorocentrum_lima.AAC.1